MIVSNLILSNKVLEKSERVPKTRLKTKAVSALNCEHDQPRLASTYGSR